jgi:hypothetical protein
MAFSRSGVRSYQRWGRPLPVLMIVNGGRPTFLCRHLHGACERRGVGWFTLCNIPCARAIFAGSPEGWVSLCHQKDLLINQSKS